jgi:cation-transporting ATPase I
VLSTIWRSARFGAAIVAAGTGAGAGFAVGVGTAVFDTLRTERRRGHRVGEDRFFEVHLPDAGADEFAALLTESLEALDGVVEADVLPGIGRTRVRCSERVDDAAVLDTIEVAERHWFGTPPPFWRRRVPFPGDDDELRRLTAEMGLDFVSGLAAIGFRTARLPRFALPIELASVASMIESTPPWRERLDRLFGPVAADVGLQLVNAFNYSFIQGLSGPVTALSEHALRRRAVVAQRRLWQVQAREWKPRQGPVTPPHPESERAEMPDGPIEAYSRRVVPASLGSFAFGAVLTGSVRNATSLLFGGAPKPARVGRDAFAATLMKRFADAGILVTDPRALARLDRLGEVVIDAAMLRPVGVQLGEIEILDPGREADARDRLAALFNPERPRATQRAGDWRLAWRARRRRLELTRAGRPVLRAGIRPVAEPAVDALIHDLHAIPLDLVVVDTDDRKLDLTFEPTERVSGALPDVVRERQARRRGVLFIGRGESEAYAYADVSIGLGTDEQSPWGAHIALTGSLAEAERVVAAIATARTASHQSVYAAAVEAGASLILATGGLKRSLVPRIMLTANLTSLLAMANAVRLGREPRLRPRVALQPQRPWHRMEVDDVLEALASRRKGLRSADLRRRDRRPRIRERSATERFSELLADELTNPFAPILIASSVMSALVGALIDALLIGAVMAVDSLISAWQQFSAERELAALSDGQRQRARVLRDGAWHDVDEAMLVRGDVIRVHSGDLIPADARLLEVDGLEVDESSLTGESFPASKRIEAVRAAAVAERRNMIFAGTSVASGHAVGVVTAVGEATEARRAAEGAERSARSGVTRRLEHLTQLTVPISALAGAVLMASGRLRGRPHAEVVGTGVSLAVAAVPEGLPLLATLAEVAASKRLARRDMLVRRAESIEALGRIDVLCADKTGTLTTGMLKLAMAGDGEAEFDLDGRDGAARELLQLALMATPGTHGGTALPHPTDRAVVDAARAAGATGDFEIRSSLQFKPDRGYHAGLCDRAGRRRLVVKGAPEVVIPLCRRGIDRAARDALIERAEALAARGLRVLAIAERPCRVERQLADKHVDNLEFRGFIGLRDPLRPAALDAVDYLRRAGVDTIMITGDHPDTARAIGGELGLDGKRVLTGPVIDGLDDDGLAEALDDVRIFARVSPAQKVRIVKALQAKGRTVAMTGDGANDAAAIRLADAGIAVGPGATAAAREAADLIITDESIDRIVEAIAEGRALWSAVRDAVAMLVGGNVGELVFALFGGIVEGRSPMNTRQLLLVNLLTDALPALAIATRPPDHLDPERMLAEGPTRSLGPALNRQILWRAGVTGVVATGAWAAARIFGPRAASTVGLLTVVGTQLAPAALMGGGDRRVLLVSAGSLAALFGVVQTPVVSGFFGCRPLGPVTLAQALAAIGLGTAVTVLGPRMLERANLDAARLVPMLPERLAERLGPLLLDSGPARAQSASA